MAAFVKATALDLGLTCVGITEATADQRATARFNAFLDAGRHGTMAWLTEKLAWRTDPQAMWPDAQTAIVIGMSYAPERDPLDALNQKSRAVVSAYAKRRDYHDVVKKRIKALARAIAEKSGAGVKVFVDTAPVMEKPLAARAGLGWQGKHTNLVARDFGSWLFLGVILTSMRLPNDTPHDDLCGSCRRCLDVCPTNAFPAPYQLDARRCIAYLTIEHDGPIPAEFRHAIGNRVFGCDDCLAVCPWNKFAGASADHKLAIQNELDDPPIATLLALDDAAFRKLFANTPVKRTGHAKIIRNALIAAGNSGDVGLLDAVRRHLTESDAMVRGAAVWALGQLLPAAAFDAERRDHLATEADADVIAEWLGTNHD